MKTTKDAIVDVEQLRAWPVDSLTTLATLRPVPAISGWEGHSATAAQSLSRNIDHRADQITRKVVALTTISSTAATQVRQLQAELTALQEQSTTLGFRHTPSGVAVGVGSSQAQATLSRIGADLLRRADAVDDLITELLGELIDEPQPEAEPAPVGPASTAHAHNVAKIVTERQRLTAALTSSSALEKWYLQRKLDDLAAIDQILQSHPEALLLKLDMTGQRGRAAIALGNPDTAQHVSVTVPGLDTDIASSLPRMVDEAADLRHTAQSLLRDPTEQVATIAWLDYLPPQLEGPTTASLGGYGVGPGLWQVTSDARARAGAVRLDTFLDGLRPDQHVTVLGHSYGSLTASLALQRDTLATVDDAVFYGSPGLFAASAADVRLPEGHAFLMEADGDPVADIGFSQRFGPDPSTGTFTRLSTDAADADAHHPALTAATGHSQYPHAGTTSQFNLAAIVAGRHDLALPAR